MTMTHKEFTLYELGSLGPCISSDGSTLRGFFSSAGGRGSGTCASAYITDAPFIIGWSDGTKSEGRALTSTVGPVAFGIGEITSGAFAGMSFSSRPMLAPQHPEGCASAGVNLVDYHGEIVFD
ncbi:MAG: hypothetical protein ACT4P1_16145 [Sporichthyaceae bacterium]